MPKLNIQRMVSCPGVSMAANWSRDENGGDAREVTVPVGKSGTLSARTDSNTGTITLGTGHGITTGMQVHLYFTTGVQYNVTVGTVSGNSVPIDGGSGTALPATSSVVIVAPVVTVSFPSAGPVAWAMQMAYADQGHSARSYVCFINAQAENNFQKELRANEPLIYDVAGGDFDPNDTSYPMTSVLVSNASLTLPATFKLIWSENVST